MQYLGLKNIIHLIILGIIAGLVGIVLTLSMHTIQYFSFGYSIGGETSFREIVETASPLRRIFVLVICGCVVGFGWKYIHQYSKMTMPIKNIIKSSTCSMTLLTTLCHGFLQIFTIAMGSPLGRETAPREISAAFAANLLSRWQVDEQDKHLFLSCAAGAGLAAVYNVPIAAVIFTLETLIHDWSLRPIFAAMLCCTTAVTVVHLGLGDFVQYSLPQVLFNGTIVIWAFLIGPIIGISVICFEKSLKMFSVVYQKNFQTILIAILAFACIGILSVWYPEILGNGKAGNQLSFTYSITWQYGLGLFIAKWLVVILATFAGAYGGRITPSMMLGGMLGLVLAVLWNKVFPIIDPGMAAFICAAVYLGLAQKMPLTAGVLLLEMSRCSPEYLFPICACLSTAAPVFKYFERIYNKMK